MCKKELTFTQRLILFKKSIMVKKITSFIILAIIASGLYAQIPNGGFENWDTTASYKIPVAWDNMNSTTKNLSIYTCTAGTPGSEGASFLMLVSHSITGMGVIPGVASPGVMNKYDANHPRPQSGFPYTGRPNYFSGMWQYMASGTDRGYISVLLSKWDSTANRRDTVASVHYKLPGMVMLWLPFSIPLSYQSSATPDSAIIMLSASGLVPAAGSYLFVDQLAFTDTAMNTGIEDINSLKAGVDVFPTPANDHLTVKILSNTATIKSITLSDMTGRVIRDMPGNNSTSYTFSTVDISGGSYLIRLLSSEGTAVRKVIIE